MTGRPLAVSCHRRFFIKPSKSTNPPQAVGLRGDFHAGKIHIQTFVSTGAGMAMECATLALIALCDSPAPWIYTGKMLSIVS